MSRTRSLAAIIAASVALAGCSATRDAAVRADEHHAPPKLLAKKARGAKSQTYDKPAEALRFHVEQRLPDGATALDPKLYETARREAARLPWYAAATGSIARELDIGVLSELSAWEQLGPGNIGGRTRVLRFHPGNPNILYTAGVAGGVWKSTNAGNTWTPLSDLATNLAVASMVIDSANPNRLWIGTGEGVFNADAARGAGIFVSNDAGLSWNQLPTTDNADFFYVNDLVQSPNAPGTLYAATRAGVMRSLDSGATWTKVIDTSAAGLNMFGGCFDLNVTGTPQDIALATCGTIGYNAGQTALASGAILRNPDAGGAGTWTSVLSPGAAGNMGRAMVAHAPSNPLVVYALVAGGVGSTNADGLLGVWRSDDAGATWSPKVQNTGTNANNNLLLTNPVIARLEECFNEPAGSNSNLNQGWYDLVLAVDPVNPDRVWAGGIDLWRSDDQGANWGVASYWWFDGTDPNYAHADNHGIFFHPGYDGVANKQMFVTSDGGIYRTDDATAAVGTDTSAGDQNSICGNANLPALTWSNLNNGYAVTQFYHGTVYPDNQTFFGGTQDNGTNRGTVGAPNAWSEVYGGDGGYTAVDPTNTQVIYFETTGTSIRKSTDGGASSSPATTGISGDPGSFINPFTMDPNDANRLWTSGRRLWRTSNAATSWVQAASTQLAVAAPFTSSHRFSAHAVAPKLSDLVIVGSSQGQLWRGTTATTSTSATAWTGTTTGANGRPRSGNVGMIAFDPTQNETVANERRAIAVYSAFNSATTPGGGLAAPHVWKSTDGGQTWVTLDGVPGASIPNVPVHSVAIDPTTPNMQRIFVGTDIGVFVTTDGGQTWMRENAGGANTVIEWLTIQRNPATGKYELFAFTHGRSTYVTTFEPGEHIFENGFD